jgi:hypothetical protein
MASILYTENGQPAPELLTLHLFSLVGGEWPPQVMAMPEDEDGDELPHIVYLRQTDGSYLGENGQRLEHLTDLRQSFKFPDLSQPCPYCSEFSEDFTARNKAHSYNGGILAAPEKPEDVVRFVAMDGYVMWLPEQGSYGGTDHAHDLCGAC